MCSSWAPEGKRGRGWPRETWRRTAVGERDKMGLATWNEAVAMVRDRAVWARQVNDPILSGGNQG